MKTEKQLIEPKCQQYIDNKKSVQDAVLATTIYVDRERKNLI